jgi:hypothetical protein
VYDDSSGTYTWHNAPVWPTAHCSLGFTIVLLVHMLFGQQRRSACACTSIPEKPFVQDEKIADSGSGRQYPGLATASNKVMPSFDGVVQDEKNTHAC